MRFVLQRIILRSLNERDADEVFALTSDPRVARYMRFDTHMERAQAEELICHYTENGAHGFAVLEKLRKTFIGVIAIAAGEEEGDYSLSVFLSPKHWGCGYAGEALAAVCAYAKDMLEAKTLSAYVCEPNLASRGVLERQGFTVFRRQTVPEYPDGLLLYRYRL